MNAVERMCISVVQTHASIPNPRARATPGGHLIHELSWKNVCASSIDPATCLRTRADDGSEASKQERDDDDDVCFLCKSEIITRGITVPCISNCNSNSLHE